MVALPAMPAAPPEMPAVFDRATVERLVATIDQSRNDIVLKIGYFARHAPGGLPTVEGVALLNSGIDREPKASKRWFMMQEVRGFAGFHAGDVPTDEGFTAFQAIFDNARGAKAAGATYTVSKAVGDYVSDVPIRIALLGLGGDPRTRRVLLSAWRAACTESPQAGVRARSLPWGPAVDACGGTEEFEKVLDEQLRNPATRRTYSLLTTAAAVLGSTRRKKAIALLREAGPMVPQQDQGDQVRFYDAFVNVLSDKGATRADLAEAASVQRKRIGMTNAGRGEIALLYHDGGDRRSFEQVVKELCAAGAPDGDVVSAAEMMTRRPDRAGQASAVGPGSLVETAMAVLRAYLSPGRPRIPAQDLRGRYDLGSILASRGQLDAALDVLQTAAEPGATIDPLYGLYLNDIRGLRSSIGRAKANGAGR